MTHAPQARCITPGIGQDMEATKMSLENGTDTGISVHRHNELPLSHKKKLKRNVITDSVATWVELHVIIPTKLTHTNRDEQEPMSLTQIIWKLAYINPLHTDESPRTKKKPIFKKGNVKGRNKLGCRSPTSTLLYINTKFCWALWNIPVE